MNYTQWIEHGSAITMRSPDPYANVIIVPVIIRTIPELCREGEVKIFNTLAIIDTGATISAIDSGIAKSLGLIAISKCTVNGVHGPSDVDMFSFDMNIGNSMNIKVRQATEGQFRTSAFKVLIGMDILRLGEFYLGQEEKDGKCIGTIFSFSIPPTGNVIDYAEKLNKVRRHRKRS